MNNIGQGAYSTTVKCQTKSLPPDAPQLECVSVTCNSLKLKWNTVNHLTPTVVNNSVEQAARTNRTLTYVIEMEGKDGK